MGFIGSTDYDPWILGNAKLEATQAQAQRKQSRK
jgi:hypothetical protein